MAWYLKWPANSGATLNKSLVQITGISGTLATVKYTLAENLPAYSSVNRWIFDIRRLPDSVSAGAGNNALVQNGVSSFVSTGTSNWKINGASVAASALFGTISADSVCEFDVGVAPSSGCIAFGARYSETEAFYNLAIKNIVIIDAAGTHTIDMSSSGGTSNEFTSTDGAVTLKLFNFTGGQWVFYSSGATYQLTAQGGTFSYSGSSAALNRGYKLAAQGATYTYTGASANLAFNVATVYRMDALGSSYSYVGSSAYLLRGFKLAANGSAYNCAGADAVLRRGFKLAASGGAFNYSGADASLTYVSGPTVYRLTALGVTYVYSGGVATLTGIGVAPAANPNAFINAARVGGTASNSAKIGSLLSNSARIDGIFNNKGRLSQ